MKYWILLQAKSWRDGASTFWYVRTPRSFGTRLTTTKTGKEKTIDQYCYSVGRLEWDEKEEGFNFKSIGLRWLESNPSTKVIKMILGFCEMMTPILENNDTSIISGVYRTPSGKKYHFDAECGGKNSFKISIDEAKSAGLTPCSKCAE